MTKREEAALEVALMNLQDGGSDSHAGPMDLETESLSREYLEVLGLLTYSLEPEAPPPQLRAALLNRLTGEGAENPAAQASRVSTFPLPAIPAFAPPPKAPFWPSLLAATLALCVLGLGFLTYRQQTLLNQIVAGGTGANPIARENARLRAELADVENRFDMVTAIAERMYPLRPPGTSTHTAATKIHGPSGVMYVCPNHQQWYLNVRGLEPPPAGSHYELWFVTDSGLISNGPVEVHRFGPTELRAPTMPDETRSVMITLEPSLAVTGLHSAPEGRVVLEAGESVQLTL